VNADLVVVGAGLAGLTAAARASELGLRVMVLEAGMSEDYECNSRYSGGNLHVAHRDPRTAPVELAAGIRAITGGHAREDLVELMATQAAPALAWLEAWGAQLGRRGDGDWQAAVLTPIGEQGAGLSWAGRGADVTLRGIADRLRARSGAIELGHEAISIQWDHDGITGIEANGPRGRVSIATPSVVLADGGFQGDPALLARFVMRDPTRVRLRAAGTARGTGLRFALEAGADLWWPEIFYGCLLHRAALDDDHLWPYPMLDQLAIAGFIVDRAGTRFVDEGRGGPFMANAVARLDDPLSAVIVCDAPAWNRAGRKGLFAPNPNLQRSGAVVHSAMSLADLADKAGLDRLGVVATARTYNAAVGAGKTATLPVPRSVPSGAASDDHFFAPATPVESPPFFAIPVCVGLTFTTGGPTIDASGRVLRGGQPISGLYAAGATSGGLEGGPAAAYVSGLMKALVTGLAAGGHSAARVTAAW
jgi:fumarate reductase flavoprotein subunit